MMYCQKCDGTLRVCQHCRKCYACNGHSRAYYKYRAFPVCPANPKSWHDIADMVTSAEGRKAMVEAGGGRLVPMNARLAADIYGADE